MAKKPATSRKRRGGRTQILLSRPIRRMPPPTEGIRRIREIVQAPLAVPSHRLVLSPPTTRVVYGPKPSLPLPPSRRTQFLGLNRLLANPRVTMCVRRKQRREVLFAMRRAGFSGSAPGPYRRTNNSSWSC